MRTDIASARSVVVDSCFQTVRRAEEIFHHGRLAGVGPRAAARVGSPARTPSASSSSPKGRGRRRASPTSSRTPRGEVREGDRPGLDLLLVRHEPSSAASLVFFAVRRVAWKERVRRRARWCLTRRCEARVEVGGHGGAGGGRRGGGASASYEALERTRTGVEARSASMPASQAAPRPLGWAGDCRIRRGLHVV